MNCPPLTGSPPPPQTGKPPPSEALNQGVMQIRRPAWLWEMERSRLSVGATNIDQNRPTCSVRCSLSKHCNCTISFSKHYNCTHFLQTIGLAILIYCKWPSVITCITCYFSFKVCNNRLNPALFLYVVRSSFRNFPEFCGIIYMIFWDPGPWPLWVNPWW